MSAGRYYWDDFSDDIHWGHHGQLPRDSNFHNTSWDGYRRHWLRSRYDEPYRLSGAFDSGREAYQVPGVWCLDVHQFAPNELSVKTVDDSVVVEGRHEEKEDKHGYISRHFKRRYVIPPGYDLEHVYSTLSSDGVLTVRAPKIVPQREDPSERIIPIQQTGTSELPVVNGGKRNGATNGHRVENGDKEQTDQRNQ